MLLRRPRLLALLLLGWSCLAHGELDEIHSRLLAPYAVPLRWDNIEAAPAWLGGVQPVYRKDKGYHTVRLTLGEWTEVRVAAGEQLRLTTVEGAFTPSDLRLMRANGRGLYAEVMPQPSSDRRHWLVGAETAAASIYRLEHIGQDSGPLEIALFASRHTPLGELAPYRQVLPLPGQAVSLRAAAVAAAQTYWRLESDQPIALKVTGPRRLALDNRMLYPASESGLLQSWRVQCWLDDRPLHTAEMESNVESRQEVFVDRASTVVSRAERFYLEIPSGEHHLRLRASAPLLARLLAQASTDYLFPELNQPRLTAEAARADLDPDEAVRSSWQRGPREIAAAALATANVSAVEHAALRLAMDTRWREGGSVGAALLAQAALARPEDQTLATRARHFSGAHTFFRDLLPVAKIESAAMTYRWFRRHTCWNPARRYVTWWWRRSTGRRCSTVWAAAISSPCRLTARSCRLSLPRPSRPCKALSRKACARSSSSNPIPPASPKRRGPACGHSPSASGNWPAVCWRYAATPPATRSRPTTNGFHNSAPQPLPRRSPRSASRPG